MKALSLLQPWASLVAIGAKRIETRSWPKHPARFRHLHTPLAIHSSKRYDRKLQELSSEDYFSAALSIHYTESGHGFDLPTGAVIAITSVLNVVPAERIATADHAAVGDLKFCGGQWHAPKEEFIFGNLEHGEGRIAWLLSPPKLLQTPIPAKGRLGIWEWNPPKDFLDTAGLDEFEERELPLFRGLAQSE